MVVHEGVKRFPDCLQAPHIVGNLKVVVVVVTRVESFVELVICDGMQHFRIDPAAVFAVDHLAHEPEVRFHGGSFFTKLFHEPEIQDIRAVQTDPVDIKIVDPEADRVEQILADIRIP